MPHITLRKRKISGNRFSLVADTYPTPPSGKRFQALGLYIDAKPADKLQREHNKDILGLARGIVARQQNELTKPEVYTRAEKEALEQAELRSMSFVKFCTGVIGKIEGGSSRVYQTALRYFLLFLGVQDITCGEITLLMVDEFREYLPSAKKLRLDAVISQNSAATYLAGLKGMLQDAYKAGHLIADLGKMVDSLPTAAVVKEVLTTGELVILNRTECTYPDLKQMALFSALTGLRFSDCSKLDWDEVRGTAGSYYLDFTQKKTSGEAIIPISDQAYSLIPPQRKNPFAEIDYNNMQRPLKKWIAAAGITKAITFHNLRHTYTNILLANDVDLFTVSKMLGHKSIRSTQVYAKPVDQKKIDAARTMNIKL